MVACSLDSFHNFLSCSCKRLALLCEVDQAELFCCEVELYKLCSTCHQGCTLFCVAFDKIMTELGWDKETTAESASLKQKLQDFDFTFLLGVFQAAIFGLTEPLFQVLKSKMVDIITRIASRAQSEL